MRNETPGYITAQMTAEPPYSATRIKGAFMHVSFSNWLPPPYPIDDGACLIAVGDIHGHAGELLAMRNVILSQVQDNPQFRCHVIYLGDYIDRGKCSRKVLEILASGIGNSIDEIFLVGNHDQFLVELLNFDEEIDKRFISAWYENGGTETMTDLGVDGYGRLVDKGDLRELSARTRNALGEELVGFLRSLDVTYRYGNYVFVHAGIDPKRRLCDQDFADLLLIREPFLSSSDTWIHDFCVVHGHSISVPSIHPHRISVDSGCYRTGALCAVQIANTGVRFIAITQTESHSWLSCLGPSACDWAWSIPTPVILEDKSVLW